MVKWIIEDWAGNHLFKEQVFDNQEDGFDFLLEQFPEDDEFEPKEVELVN